MTAQESPELNQLEWKLPSQAGPKERPMWWALLILLALVAYVPAIKSGFIWDDNRHVSENKNLVNTDGLANIWTKFGLVNGGTPQYYPMTHTFFWVEHQIWGNDPLGYHLVNVILHGISAALIWELLRRLKVPGAWLAAAIWAVHPINVETVAWVSEMKNVLAGVFFFGGILAYLQGAGIEDPDGLPWLRLPKLPAIAWFGISFGLYTCALLSKTVACSMPVVIALILWWKRKLTVRDIGMLIPFVLVGIGLGLNTAHMEKQYVGAMGDEWNFSFAQRILIAGNALWFYIGKTLLPVHQSFIYPRWDIDHPQAWWWIFPALTVVVLLALAAFAKVRRWPLVAFLYFGITLFPALGFFNVYPMRYAFVADHFQYLSGIAIIAIVAAGASYLVRNIQVAAIAACALLAVLSVATWVRGNVYLDEITLWQDVIAKNPNSWMAHHNYGVALQKEGIEFTRAGANDDAKKNFEEAEKQFKKTLEIDPQHEWAHYALGTLYVLEHRVPEAEAQFHESLKVTPDPAKTYAQLGFLMMQKKDNKAAEDYLKKSIDAESKPLKARIIPQPLAETRIALGEVYEAEGKNADAEKMYLDALNIKPNSRQALIRIGVLLGARGKTADAAEAFKAVLRDDQQDAEAWKLLGNALALEGQVKMAELALQQSLTIKPDQKDVKATLQLVQQALTHPATRPTTRALAATMPATTRSSH